MFYRRIGRMRKHLWKFLIINLIILLILLFAKNYNDLSNYTNKINGRETKLELTRIEEKYERYFREYESKIVPNLGNLGEAAHLEGKDKEEGDKTLKKVALNTVLSDRIPLNRTLRDPRHVK